MFNFFQTLFGSTTYIDLENATLNDCEAGKVFRTKEDGKYVFFALPSFLIAGVQKGGTAEMRTWLSAHPALSGPVEELHFFKSATNLEKDWKHYVRNPGFSVPYNGLYAVRTFEKTPNYFDGNVRKDWSSVPECIHRMMPSCKIIILLRNPTDRAYSAYNMKIRGISKKRFDRVSNKLKSFSAPYMQRRFQNLINKYHNPEPTPPFSEIIDQHIHKEIDYPTGHHYPRGFSTIISRGCYARFFPKWFELFGHEQLYINTLEHWIEHPFSVIDEVQEFLGLDYFDYRKIAHKNKRGFWVLKEQSSKGNRKAYDKMNDDDREKLNAFYEPWNEKLRTMLPNVPIPW